MALHRVDTMESPQRREAMREMTLTHSFTITPSRISVCRTEFPVLVANGRSMSERPPRNRILPPRQSRTPQGVRWRRDEITSSGRGTQTPRRPSTKEITKPSNNYPRNPAPSSRLPSSFEQLFPEAKSGMYPHQSFGVLPLYKTFSPSMNDENEAGCNG